MYSKSLGIRKKREVFDGEGLREERNCVPIHSFLIYLLLFTVFIK